MEIREVIQSGQQQLKDISDCPTLDAQWLLLHVLKKKDVSWLVLHGNEELSTSQLSTYQALLQERITGKPLAYLLKQWDFYGRTFVINENVLIPRPATENLIDNAKVVMEELHTTLKRPLLIADIGTGSGCIAVTLLLECPYIQKVYATDIFPQALEVAKENAKKYNLTNQIEFLEGSMLAPLKEKKIDLIVSNPPYIPSDELTKETTKNTIGLTFEPQQALNGGPDGQLYIDQIIRSKVPAVVEGLGGEIFTYNVG